MGTQLPRGFSALPIPKIYQKNIINKNSQSDFYLDKLFGHDLDLSTGAPNLQKNFTVHTVNPLLTPPPQGAYLFQALLRGGRLFNLAKCITCSCNTVISDRVDLHVVQLKSLSKVFNSLVGS